MELREEYIAREWRHGCCSRTKKRCSQRASECELKQTEENGEDGEPEEVTLAENFTLKGLLEVFCDIESTNDTMLKANLIGIEQDNQFRNPTRGLKIGNFKGDWEICRLMTTQENPGIQQQSVLYCAHLCMKCNKGQNWYGPNRSRRC